MSATFDAGRARRWTCDTLPFCAPVTSKLGNSVAIHIRLFFRVALLLVIRALAMATIPRLWPPGTEEDGEHLLVAGKRSVQEGPVPGIASSPVQISGGGLALALTVASCKSWSP